MDKSTVICRCQEITYGEVLEAIREGAVTVAGVKTRVGSGRASARSGTAKSWWPA